MPDEAVLPGLLIGLAVGCVLGAVLWSVVTRRRGDDAKSILAAFNAMDEMAILVSGGSISLSSRARTKLGDESFASLEALADRIAGADQTAFLDSVLATQADGVARNVLLRDPSQDMANHLGTGMQGDALIIRIEERPDIISFERELDRLKAVLNALPLPVWWRDGSSKDLVGVNQTYARMVGADDLSQALMRKEITQGVIGHRGRALAERAMTVSGVHSESHHMVVDGQRRLLDFSEARLPEEMGIVGFAEDRTGLENVQASLAEHIDAQDEVLEHMLTAIAIFGPDRRIRFFNQAYRDMWSLDEDWLRREPFLDEIVELLHDLRKIPEIVDFRDYKRGLTTQFTSVTEPFDDFLYLPDDRTIRKTVTPYPLGGLMYIFEDVTDRLALERSFNTLTKVQQATLNNLYEGVVVYGSDGRLRLHNREFREIWKLDETFLSKGPHLTEVFEELRDRFPEEMDWDSFRNDRLNAVLNRQPSSGRFFMRDNRIVDYVHVLLPDGQILLLYLDVTDSVNVQRALQERNAALENVDLLKAQFISNMSYDLRTPLNAIIGFTEILHNGIAGPLSDRQASYAADVLDASKMLAGLVSDLLDLASIQAGFMTLDLHPCDIGALVGGLVAETQPVASAKDIDLVLEGVELGVPITCDPERMYQAFEKLVSNAIKYTPPNGQIRVEMAASRDSSGNAETVSVSITDTGTGISNEERARVFENFVQASSSDAQQSGAGLGLALSKSLLELHGGDVRLSEAAGGGTTVTCTLLREPTSTKARGRKAAE